MIRFDQTSSIIWPFKRPPTQMRAVVVTVVASVMQEKRQRDRGGRDGILPSPNRNCPLNRTARAVLFSSAPSFPVRQQPVPYLIPYYVRYNLNNVKTSHPIPYCQNSTTGTLSQQHKTLVGNMNVGEGAMVCIEKVSTYRSPDNLNPVLPFSRRRKSKPKAQ